MKVLTKEDLINQFKKINFTAWVKKMNLEIIKSL